MIRSLTSDEFLKLCREEVADYFNEHVDKTDDVPKMTPDDVYVVWFCWILGNCKALLSTPVSDGMYYECTYNDINGELYFDAYKKFEHRCIGV